ncbi:MAG: thiol oxidoreductase [Ignavibacteria bacterium]|jgi:CxxC motif-containing protein (DUF1111 family)|nr:thiol oxidoreductase [Ignavibacteria bacterium]
MMKHFLICIVAAFLLASCDFLLPPAPVAEDTLAEPLEGLTEAQQANHIQGDTEFARSFGVADGLGPMFNAPSCESCHIGDGKGHALTTLIRFGRMNGATFDPMTAHGGPQLQNRSIAGYLPETLPTLATGVTRLLPPAVTGLGYLAAVSDETLLALADPDDLNGDGISGVPNYDEPPDFFEPLPMHKPLNGRYIGRFGRKAGAIDLLQQTAAAYRNDMGITSDFIMQDLANVQTGAFTGDNVPDPEVSASVVRNVVFYLRTLKAPPRRNANATDVKAGEQIFARIGCAGCHVPTLKTGASDIAVLNEVEFHPYTDLLLHDMGAELDDKYTEGSAKTAEWRTTPLWGVGLSAQSQGGAATYLHDGRARTLPEAIQAHGGEASRSRTRFNALTGSEKQQLITFLQSL